MLIGNGDGTFLCGPWDVIVIYQHHTDGTFHPAFYQESPMPGAGGDGVENLIRLKSKMHHTDGFATLEEAQASARDLQAKLGLSDDNVVLDLLVPWDGEIGDVMIVQNWRRADAERPFRDVMAH